MQKGRGQELNKTIGLNSPLEPIGGFAHVRIKVYQWGGAYMDNRYKVFCGQRTLLSMALTLAPATSSKLTKVRVLLFTPSSADILFATPLNCSAMDLNCLCPGSQNGLYISSGTLLAAVSGNKSW